MSHTYAKNMVHVVFSTKNRRKIIAKDLQPKMWAYMAGICKNVDIFVVEIGGMEDHVHLLIQIPPKIALAKAVATIKANSSRWAGEQGHKFSWQEGYGAFSVSVSIADAVVRYIQNQELHHLKMGFDEEFIAMLKKHAVAFDPKFVLG
ncbi:MAG: IS200/IS605 family transposase [Acidobacteria bacterium]|nr:IS200/IS605 family transposase [Acidobacteriota bacterium]MBS1866555.1 IS200/IS605 family transposase [Acidobacteriota bacterium]